ncbi:Holliday junction ATP-dependent DNA helicase RuvA [Bacteroidia bacterium]|nr:Holliday junction ATP-dependent DNA helicase RuvA [Bacteroidia bacterium]
MYEYISGILKEARPAYAVIDCGGVGYNIRTTVNTYSKISSLQSVTLYTHLIVREDAHLLYGFFSPEERAIFCQLISVSGIGPNTASVMLSSMTVEEIVTAIQTDNVNTIQRVKGIGLKTAQRVVIELKDKVTLGSGVGEFAIAGSSEKEEALSALVTLGFVKNQVSKAIDKIIAENGRLSVEELIKRALRIL